MSNIMFTALRVCRVCGIQAYIEEELDLFTKDKNSKYGKQNLCKKCENERQREYYEENREKRLGYGKKYRDSNLEKARERERYYYYANRDKELERNRKYRDANPEVAIKYRKNNRERIKQNQIKYQKANREKINERRRKRYQNAPFKFRVQDMKKRANKNGLDFDLDENYLQYLWKECCGVCKMTGVKMLKKTEINNPYSMSVDRLDSDKGYVKDNVRLVSRWYNVSRNKWGDKFTFEMCQRVIKMDNIWGFGS